MDEETIIRLKNLISQGMIYESLKIIVQSIKDNNDNDIILNDISNMAIQYMSRCSILKRERELGIINSNDYTIENNNLNWSTIQLVNSLENSSLSSDSKINEFRRDNEIRIKRIKEIYFIDRIFKIILVLTFSFCFFLLLRSVFLMSDKSNWEGGLLNLFVALSGGFASFTGYLKLRIVELKWKF